jgi:isopentenyldiphosphate isomerase
MTDSTTTTAAVWKQQAAGLSQVDLLQADTVICVNEQDEILGSASKHDSHVFSIQQSHGILHRAFSVFVLDLSTQSLLLQQRAAEKITFPNVRKLIWYACVCACV